jgi:hypothetical protein
MSEQTSIKNMLVLAGGGGSDHAVFATAFGIAQPLGAHLDFSVYKSTPAKLYYGNRIEFARGSAMRERMQRLETECVMRTAVARDNFAQFCELHGIGITDEPRFDRGISAGWREEMGDADRRLIFRARHYDLVAAGRPMGLNGLPPDLLERLLLGCGRPLLIAPAQLSDPFLVTVMVCWKETAEAARAVAAAMPLLAKAEHVTLASVEEDNPSLTDGLADLACHLAWHGISSEIELIPAAAGAAGEMLMAPCQSAGNGRLRTRRRARKRVRWIYAVGSRIG